MSWVDAHNSKDRCPMINTSEATLLSVPNKFDPSPASMSSNSDDYIIPSGEMCVATSSNLLDHNLLTSDTELTCIFLMLCVTPPGEREYVAVYIYIVGLITNTRVSNLKRVRATGYAVDMMIDV